MNFNRIYGLFLRHMYLIIGSVPRIIDLVYWPTIQILLWGFISKFFTLNSVPFNEIDMLTVIIIGNSQTTLVDEIFLTPRGYLQNQV